MTKDNKTKHEKKNDRVIFIIIGTIILVILGIFIYMNFFANANTKSFTIQNNQMEDFTISGLKFEPQTDGNQINITMLNTLEENLDIKSIIVKIRNKEKINDEIELEYNQVLLAGNKNNFSLGYKSESIDKISFEVIFND